MGPPDRPPSSGPFNWSQVLSERRSLFVVFMPLIIQSGRLGTAHRRPPSDPDGGRCPPYPTMSAHPDPRCKIKGTNRLAPVRVAPWSILHQKGQRNIREQVADAERAAVVRVGRLDGLVGQQVPPA